MLDQIEDLNKKMDEIEEEGSDYDEEESDQDLGSELEDTLDANDLNRGINDRDKVSDASPVNAINNAGSAQNHKSHPSENQGGSEVSEEQSESSPSKNVRDPAQNSGQDFTTMHGQMQPLTPNSVTQAMSGSQTPGPNMLPKQTNSPPDQKLSNQVVTQHSQVEDHSPVRN